MIIEKGKDGLDIYQYAYPIIKQIGSEIQTAEAPLDVKQPIKDYFILASSPECHYFNDNYGKSLFTMGCQIGETIVKYDQYFSDISAEDTFTNLANHSDIADSSADEWRDANNPDVMLGRVLFYTDKAGGVGIFWTVYRGGLSGWVYNSNGDQSALREFWRQTAAAHN